MYGKDYHFKIEDELEPAPTPAGALWAKVAAGVSVHDAIAEMWNTPMRFHIGVERSPEDQAAEDHRRHQADLYDLRRKAAYAQALADTAALLTTTDHPVLDLIRANNPEYDGDLTPAGYEWAPRFTRHYLRQPAQVQETFLQLVKDAREKSYVDDETMTLLLHMARLACQ